MKLLLLVCLAIIPLINAHSHHFHFHSKGPCGACYEKALEDAEEMNGHWKKNFVGHACRGGKGLDEYCRLSHKSKNGGLPANNWFFVHCSPDGPWCKPCATKKLFFVAKCDACEKTHRCTGK